MTEPSVERPFGEVEATLEKSGRVEELIRLYETRSREVPQPEEAGHLLARAGLLARERLKNPHRAEGLYRRALVYAPGGREALEGLRALYEQRSDSAALVDVLERIAQTTPGSAAAALYLRAGELCEQKLNRRDRAVLCYQLASRVAPQERAGYARARALLLEEGRYAAAYESLERERAALGERELLEDYLAFAQGLLLHPKEHALATKALVRALAIDDKNAKAQATQKELSKLEYVWRDKVKAVRAQSLEERDRRTAARLSLVVARLYAFYEPSAVDKLKEALDRCFALWPAMPDALDLLEEVAVRSGDVRAALTVFSKLAAETRDRSAQVDLHLRIGQILLTKLDDKGEAAAAFDRASRLDPSRPDAAQLASELLIETGRPEDGVAAIDRHLGTLTGSAHVDGRLALADLCERLAMAPAAIRAHLEAAAAVEPQNAQVAFRLATLLAAGGELEPLWGILDLAVSAPRPVAERIALCQRAAALCQAAGDSPRAFHAFELALPLQPGSADLLAAIGAAAAQAKAQIQLVQVLRRAAQVAPAPAQVGLLRAQGTLLQSLDRPAEAQEAWVEVQRRLPDDPEAASTLAALRKALAEAELLDPRSKLEAEAKKLEASAADPAAAAAVYRKILAIDPDSVANLRKLGAASANLGQWEEVALVAERLLALAGSVEERREWRARLAQLFAERLNRRDEAARIYLSLLEEGVETASVVGGLERLAAAGFRQAEISRALAPHYGRGGDYQRQIASLLVQLASVQDKEEQKGLLTLLADTSEKRLLDERGALDFRLRGLAADPADTAFRAEAIRLSRGLRAQQEVSRFLVELGQKVGDPEQAISLLRAAGELAREAGAVDDAAKAFKAALQRSPDDSKLMAMLSAIYWDAARWADCDQLLRKRLEVAQPEAREERQHLCLELSHVSNALGRPSEAAAALQEAIRHGADELTHLVQVAELLERSGQHRELVAVQARLIELYSSAGDLQQAAALGVARARLVETALGDKAEAIVRYAEVLAGRPTDTGAVAALENLLTDPAHREAAARALLLAYEALKDHRKQVAAYAIIADATKDSVERLSALRRLSDLHSHHLRQPEQAWASLARALLLAPDDAMLRAEARALAEDANLLDNYSRVLTEVLKAGASSAPLVLHRELADVYERKLNDQGSAIKHLAQVLSVDPKNVEALRSLQRLHRARDEWSELVPVLERLASLEPDPAAKTELDREAALTAEQKLGDLERAAINWRQIVARDVLAKDAASALDRLYQALRRPAELAFALELRRNQEGQSPQGRELAFRLAQLRQTELKDPRGALEVYRQILDEDPTHEGTRQALEAWVRSDSPDGGTAMEILDPVLARSGDHPQRIALRELRMASASTSAERARYSSEIRGILERDLGQPQTAFMHALRAFTDGLDRVEVQDELERLARETGSFEEMAEIYESTAEGLDAGDEQRLALLRRAAEVREQLGQSDDATRVWRQLLELAPQDRQALDSLSKLYERSQNARSLSEVYARKAQLAQEPAERFDLVCRAADAYEQAGEDAQAIEALKTALAIKRSSEVLVSLDRLLGRSRRVAEQADVLAQLADVAKDPEAKRTYLLRRAGLLEKEKRHPEALATYGAVLTLAPSDPQAIGGLERLFVIEDARLEAARMLEACYRQLQDAKRLVEVLDVKLTAVEAGRRLPLLNEIATLREANGQKSLALTARLRAFSEAPEDEGIRQELERLCADVGAFEELATAYTGAIERGVGEPLAGEFWRRLAVVHGDRLQRLDLAAQAWNEVLQRDPKDVSVLDALGRIYRRTSQFRELSVVMRRQLALEKSVAGQINLLFELANLAEETLADKTLAAQCYTAILERKPDDPNAHKFLARILAELERWSDLGALLGREVELAQSRGQEEEALELLVRLGRLKLTRLGDPRAALDTFQEVLRRKPAHAGAVGALEEMTRSETPLRGEAAAALEPVFAKEGDHLKLVQMLEARVVAEPSPAERAALLRKMAEVYAQYMENAEMAFVASTRALRELPDDPKSLEMALALHRAADATDELMVLLEEVAPRAADDAARANLYRALARLQTDGGQSDDAVESWKRVMELSPTDAEAMSAIGGLLAQRGRTPELLEVIKRQLTIEEDTDRRAALLLQMGALQEDQLKDVAGATTTLRRLLELRPEDPAALARMERLCEAQQRWPELADVLSRRVKQVDSAERAELLFRLGYVRETKLLDKSGAVELYGELLADNPRHAPAVQRLEQLVQREPQNQPAVEVMLRAYRASGELVKLPALLEARVSVSPDALERKALLSELASVREGQGEPELAYLALYRAFKEDPNDAGLRQRMESSAAAAESWDELVHAYEGELPRIAEPDDAARVCLILGQLYETKLGEPAKAVEAYQRARELSPEVGAAALSSLDRLFGLTDQPQAQADVLEDLAARASEPADRVGLYFRLGQLAVDRLDSPDRAAAAFQKVLEADPRHLPSLRSLELLYEEAGRSEQLYAVLETQRELVQGPERDRILARMAAVSSEGLSNLDHSIDLYRELLAKNPRNEQAFEALSTLLERGSRHEELRELLAQKLQVTIDPRELVRLNERLGRTLAGPLNRPEEAVAFFKAALERDARHRGALEALRDIFDKIERRDDLVIILRRLIPLQEDASGVKQVRIRLAEVLAQTGRREETLDAARRALEVEPHAAAELDRLFAVFQQLKAWGDAVRALEAKATALVQAGQSDAAVQALFQVADLWRDAGGKPEAAGPVLERVLEIDPANRVAYEQALELYQKVNDWRAYATVIEHFLHNLVTDEEKLATLRELARVQEHKLGAKHVAFLQFCRALPLSPSDDGLRDEIERLAQETGSHEELAAVYEQVADELPRGPLAERMYLTLARVQDQELDEPDAAEQSLRKILEFDPTNEHALDRLAKMFATRGRDTEYVVALEQKLEAVGSIEVRKEILREISRVYDEKQQKPGEAEHALMRALELEPDEKTLTTLVALQRRQQNHVAVASTLLRLRDIAATPEERSKVQVEVAQVYERDLNDDEAAIEGYRQALEFDSGNAVALDSLERLYTKVDRPAELLSVYERQLELTSDYRDRVKVLFKSAAIWEERYQNLANADACVDAALQVDPQNLGAIKTLERLRRAQERWDELIGVVDRHIQLLTDPEEKAELCVEMGDIFHQQLRVVDRAVAAYHQALELSPRCRPAMHALGTLYERSGNWPFALDMLEREAQALGTTPEAVELWFRMGKINEDMLLDGASAKRCYLEALRVDAGYLPAIRALKGIYETERDWVAYERTIIEEANQTEDRSEKAKAFLEVAKYYEGQEKRDEATRYYAEALELTPDLLEAARPLADIYLSTENWEGCERMLDIVTAQMSKQFAQGPDDGELARELCRRFYRLGYVCEKNGRRDKALTAYERAYQLDSTYLAVLEGYGNLLVLAKRHEEALKVYQSILLHHRGDLTDLEVAEIYWTLGDLHRQLNQLDRAENHFEKALGIDTVHEPSLRSMAELAEAAERWDRAAEFRQKLLQVVEGDARFEVGVALGRLAREKLHDPYMAIDSLLAAHKEKPEVLEVMDSLYVLYRESKQGEKAAEMLERMLTTPALKEDAARAKRVWFALGEISRDELVDLDKATAAFNAALNLDWRFIEAFSALEAMLGKHKRWKALDENYKRMIGRFPKTEDTHVARMTLWKALGDLYLNVLKSPDAAVEVYKVVATGLPDNAEVQEQYAQLAQTQKGHEQNAVEAWRRALPSTSSPGKVASALAELAARRKDYDSAFLAAQVVAGLIGDPGAGEREIIAKLTPYAKKREVANRQLTDRLWQQHLFHPKVRGPLSELMALLFEQAGSLYKEDFTRYGINPKKHQVDVSTAQEYQLHHYRYVSRLLGMDQVGLFSPFLVVTRERMAKRTTEPAPDPLVGVEVLHTEPISLKVGGKFFSETGQKEVYYLLGRTMSLLRPELMLTSRLSAERLEAVIQAAISLSVDRFRFTADLRAIDAERRLLERQLTEQARAALARVTKEYVKVASPNDLRNYLEGAELSATRAGAFVAGDIEPVRKMVMAETGSAFRVQPRSKIRDLMVFALGDDLHALRVAVGTNVEVQLRK